MNSCLSFLNVIELLASPILLFLFYCRGSMRKDLGWTVAITIWRFMSFIVQCEIGVEFKNQYMIDR
jgi:hypothetical protein